MFGIFTSITGFLSNYSYLIKIFIIGALGLFIFYKVSSYIQEKQELQIEKDRLQKELTLTKEQLRNSITTANENARLLDKLFNDNRLTLEELKLKHEEDLKKKQTYTIIREKTKYEKDSDFISPVLRNAIDRLYNKTTRTGDTGN